MAATRTSNAFRTRISKVVLRLCADAVRDNRGCGWLEELCAKRSKQSPRTLASLTKIELGASEIKVMKAVSIHKYGGPEVLQYEDAPRPQFGSGAVLIRVHAAGVNPADWKVREGHLKQLAIR